MDCPGIPKITYSDWGKTLHEKVFTKRTPISGSLELTFRCNNNCIHCYCNLPTNDCKEMAKELSKAEIYRILDEIVDEGCLWLLITGGEPLLRHNFKDIYLYAKKKGLLITLFTNGTLITEEIAAFLSEWPPLSIEITLYGITESTYEKITRVPNSYRKCMDGINRLLEKKLPVELKTIAMTVNLQELGDMQRYVETLGLKFRFDPTLNVRLDGGKSPACYRLSPQEVVRLDTTDEKRLKEWLEFCDKYIIGPPESDKLYLCGAGLNSFHIDPYGNLSICIMARKDAYDLKVGRFRDGWYNFIGKLREKTQCLDNRCRNCELVSLCGQCPGWAQLEHWDDESPVDYLCEIAHKRAEAFGLCLLSP